MHFITTIRVLVVYEVYIRSSKGKAAQTRNRQARTAKLEELMKEALTEVRGLQEKLSKPMGELYRLDRYMLYGALDTSAVHA